MNNIFRPLGYGSLAALAAAVSTTGVAAAHPAPACNHDWRGDTICVAAAHGEVDATGSWGNANNMPYIEIVDANTDRIVSGPFVDTHIHTPLPHGRYFASYFVISDTSGAQPAQVDSPTVDN